MRYVSPASNNGSLSINNTSCLSDQTDTGSRPLAGHWFKHFQGIDDNASSGKAET